jgi:anti-anti-sigma factor
MSVVTATQPSHPAVRQDSTVPAEPCECHIARFATQYLGPSVGLLIAEGEVDAANADKLAEYALHTATQCDRLVVDLSRLEFFGTEGFSALHMLNVGCAEVGVRWALVPSAAVARVLRICDPAGALAAAATVHGALGILQGEPRRLLQLVRKA